MRLPYPPQANHLYTVARGRKILTQAARDYKEACGWEAKAQGAIQIAGPLKVMVDVYRPRRSGDLDNVLKVLMDSLTGICWQDDSQIVEITARRFDDKYQPRVEVTVAAVKGARWL